MPRRKRSKEERALARGVRDRLRGWYLNEKRMGLSQRKLADRIKISFQTVNGWFGNPPAMPAVMALVALATRDKLNLNHFLLDDGPPLRKQIAMPDSLEEALRAHIAAELGRDAEVGEVEDVLRIMGSLLSAITQQSHAELERLRRIREQIRTDAEEARWSLRGRNEHAKQKWIHADQKSPDGSRGGSFNVSEEVDARRRKRTPLSENTAENTAPE